MSVIAINLLECVTRITVVPSFRASPWGPNTFSATKLSVFASKALRTSSRSKISSLEYNARASAYAMMVR
jgi:hypothetical protein